MALQNIREKKMKRNIRVLLFFYIFVVSIFSCKKSDENALLHKAQTTYQKKGLEGFKNFIEKNNYFPVIDTNENNATPLLLAIKNKNIDDIKLFLKKGASLDEVDQLDSDAIDYCLLYYDYDITSYLVENMPKTYWNFDTISKVIAKANDYRFIQKVISFVDNFNVCDENKKTILMLASQYNTDVRVVKYILDKGADIQLKNANEWTALMYAARYNPNPYIVEDLILRGSDCTANSVGLTPIMLAACNPNSGVLFQLLKHQSNVNDATDQGKTALMYACENQQEPASLKLLIDAGADVNKQDLIGKTALMYAAQNYKTPDSIYLLISAGADMSIMDHSGKTANEYLAENTSLSNTNLSKTVDVIKNQSEKDKPTSDVHEIHDNEAAVIDDEDKDGAAEDTDINSGE